jgi:hypothetical protein
MAAATAADTTDASTAGLALAEANINWERYPSSLPTSFFSCIHCHEDVRVLSYTISMKQSDTPVYPFSALPLRLAVTKSA